MNRPIHRRKGRPLMRNDDKSLIGSLRELSQEDMPTTDRDRILSALQNSQPYQRRSPRSLIKWSLTAGVAIVATVLFTFFSSGSTNPTPLSRGTGTTGSVTFGWSPTVNWDNQVWTFTQVEPLKDITLGPPIGKIVWPTGITEPVYSVPGISSKEEIALTVPSNPPQVVIYAPRHPLGSV